MKILLEGAPGSSKSELAKRLARNLNRDGKGKWVIIDNYVESLIERTGGRYGSEGDYEHTMMVIAKRWELEAEALHKGHSTITCGGIYESIIHAAMVSMDLPADEQALMHVMREAQIAMPFFGLMEQRAFNYNAIFRLPFHPHFHTVGWPMVINAKLPEVLDGFNRYAIVLAEDSMRTKTKHALEVIREIRRYEQA